MSWDLEIMSKTIVINWLTGQLFLDPINTFLFSSDFFKLSYSKLLKQLQYKNITLFCQKTQFLIYFGLN
jgi:hypothetical protein